MKSVLTRNYDLHGNGIGRLLKIAAFGKVVPIGNLRGGPGGRCLVVLTILHLAGNPMYQIIARYGERLEVLKRLIKKNRP